MDKCYVVSKRCLTLLYTVMLFKKYDVGGYKNRIKVAIDNGSDINDVLNERDLRILKTLTDFKVTGEYSYLTGLDAKYENKENYLVFINNYFKELCSKVFYFGLSKNLKITYKSKSKYTHKNFIPLLQLFKKTKKMSFLRSYTALLYEFIKFVRHKNKERLRLAIYSVSKWKMSVNDFVRLNVALSYLNLSYNIIKKEYISDLAKQIYDMWDIVNT